MADIKISDLPNSDTFALTDIIPIVSGNSTKKVDGSTLSNGLKTSIEEYIANDYINDINDDISTLNTKINNAIVTGNTYIKFNNIGICWGEINPAYANINVLQGTTTLPLSFNNGKCIATPVNYNNQSFELDAIAKVPRNVNGTSLTLELHSNDGKFTSGSTMFYINYVVIGKLSS